MLNDISLFFLLGLSLILDANVSDYYCSSTSSSGFKVLLHSPIETPKMKNYGFSISTGLETNVVITPKISDASDLIRKVPQKQRQCIFENEANLSYYNIYSRKNCEMECVSLLIEADCDCVLYYMPRQYNGSKICNRKKATCYEKVLFSIDSTHSQDKTCSCLPACFEINYGRELSSAKLGTGAFQTAENIFAYREENYVQNNLAIIHIYFVVIILQLNFYHTMVELLEFIFSHSHSFLLLLLCFIQRIGQCFWWLH